ncbi:TPA: hypothetical protein ACH3X1_015287 [Trebouxia sp. C0004]
MITAADAPFTDDMEFESDCLDPWERPDPGSQQNSQGEKGTMNGNDPQASHSQCEDGESSPWRYVSGNDMAGMQANVHSNGFVAE